MTAKKGSNFSSRKTSRFSRVATVGRTLAAVMLGLVEIELEYRRERKAAGIEVAKKNGKYQGRKKGTTKNTPERAKELKDKGLTVVEISQALGVRQRTVFLYLANVAA